MGAAIRGAATGDLQPFVISHANDWLGYAVSAGEYERGGYEACMSFHGSDFSAWLVREAGATLDMLDARSGAELESP